MNRLILFLCLTIPFAGIAQTDSIDIYVQDTTANANALQFGIEFGPTYGLINLNQKSNVDWDAYWATQVSNHGNLTLSTQTNRGIRFGIFARKPIKKQLGFTFQLNVASYKSQIVSQFEASPYPIGIPPIQTSVGIASYLDYQIPRTPVGFKFGPHLFYVIRKGGYPLSGYVPTEEEAAFKLVQLHLDFSIYGTVQIKQVRTHLELKYAFGPSNILKNSATGALPMGINSITYHSFSILIGLAN
jgi:hypothetical protein